MPIRKKTSLRMGRGIGRVPTEIYLVGLMRGSSEKLGHVALCLLAAIKASD